MRVAVTAKKIVISGASLKTSRMLVRSATGRPSMGKGRWA